MGSCLEKSHYFNLAANSSSTSAQVGFESVSLSCHLLGGGWSQPIKLNANTFAIIDYNPNEGEPNRVGLFTMSIRFDKIDIEQWKVEGEIYQFIGYNEQFYGWPAFQPETSTIYAENYIISLNFERKLAKLDNKQNDLPRPDSCSLIFLDDGLHIISGTIAHGHKVYDAETKCLKKTHYLDIDGRGQYAFAHSCHSNCLYIFGGYRPVPGELFDTIWKYDIAKEEWSKLEVTLPMAICGFGGACLMRDRYVLLTGYRWSDSIWIFDVESETITRSTFTYHGWDTKTVCVENEELDKQIVRGYARHVETEFGFSFGDIVDVICLYYFNEFVYLINHSSVVKIDGLDLIAELP